MGVNFCYLYNNYVEGSGKGDDNHKSNKYLLHFNYMAGHHSSFTHYFIELPLNPSRYLHPHFIGEETEAPRS
jgi:hypothetical protein